MAERTDEVTETKAAILSREPWRNADVGKRQDYKDWAYDAIHTRVEHGADKYGPVFEGIPTEQGIEECLDQLFYLFWARKHIAFLEDQHSHFRALLEEFVEWGDYSDIGQLRERVFMALTASI